MITGIGTDITDIRRIEASIARYGDRFLRRVFTDGEIAYATADGQKSGQQNGKAIAATLAKRWAAKEAVVKALGTGFGNGLYWRDVEILRDGGAPMVTLHKPTANADCRIHLSMSDDYPYALAFAVIETIR